MNRTWVGGPSVHEKIHTLFDNLREEVSWAIASHFTVKHGCSYCGREVSVNAWDIRNGSRIAQQGSVDAACGCEPARAAAAERARARLAEVGL